MFNTGAWRSQETRCDRTRTWLQQKFLRVARAYLHRLIGRDPGSTDHERDLDVELVQLPLIDGQGELTWRVKQA